MWILLLCLDAQDVSGKSIFTCIYLALASVYIFVSSPTCVFLGYLHGSDVSSLARKSSLAGLGRENSMSLVAETR